VKRPSKRKVTWIIAGLAVLAGGIWGYRAYTSRDTGEVKYQLATVGRGEVASQVTASGTLQPLVTVQVGSQVSGRIQTLHADFNARVKKGQLLAKLDPSLFESEVSKARANLTVARAGVARADAELAQARRNHKRTSALASQQLVARADEDVALAALQTAEAGVSSSRASLAQAQAALKQAETNLAYTSIYSPIDGVVISRDVNEGQTVAASMQAPILFNLAEDLAKMEVHTSVAEADVGRLARDMAVEFTVDAFPSDRFRGKVKEVRYSPTTVQNVVTYDAVVTVDNPELKLRPGMTADVTFLVEQRDDAILVPNAALRFRPPADVLAGMGENPLEARAGGEGRAAAGERRGVRGELFAGGGQRGQRADRASRRVVWKLGKQGTPEPALVQIGISDGRQTEIVSGLAEGDSIITGIVGGEPDAAQQGQSGGQGGNNRGGRRGPARFL
jgi:HlyD family secretion protein